MRKQRIREVKNHLQENKIPFKRITAIGFRHKPIVNFVTLSEYLPRIQKIYPNVETVKLNDDNKDIITSTKPIIECFIRFY